MANRGFRASPSRPSSFPSELQKAGLMEQVRYEIILVFHYYLPSPTSQRQEDFTRRDQDEGSLSHQHLRGQGFSDQHAAGVVVF